jgi:hypothetical protein
MRLGTNCHPGGGVNEGVVGSGVGVVVYCHINGFTVVVFTPVMFLVVLGSPVGSIVVVVGG